MLGKNMLLARKVKKPGGGGRSKKICPTQKQYGEYVEALGLRRSSSLNLTY